MINDTTYATVEPAPAGLAWRVTRIHHLTGAENVGKRNVFIRVFQAGRLLRDSHIRIVWGWQGQRSDEIAKPAICDKTDPDYCADIPIDKGQIIWLKVDDGFGHASDTVQGIWSGMPSDSEGNSEWHNSTDVDFELSDVVVLPTEPPVVAPPIDGDVQAQLDRMQAQIDALNVRVQSMEDAQGVRG